MSQPKPAGTRRIRGLDADERRQQRRDALFASALELFATQGYLNTSIEQLCQHAYVGTKAFYEAFDSREDLYVALLRDIADTILAGLAEAAPGFTSEEDASAGLIAQMTHAFIDDVRYAKVTFGEGSAITPEAERQRRTNRRLAAGFVESIWTQYGVSITPRHHDAAIGLIGGLFDILADWVADHPADQPAPGDIDDVITRLTNFYNAVRHGL